MKKLHSVKLTEDQFSSIKFSGKWAVDDIPKEYWPNIPGIQRLNDTFAIMGSANINNPTQIYGLDQIVAGVDVLTSETNPKPNEPDGNAYHYVFQYIPNDEFPYRLYGPFIKCEYSKVPHWFDFSDLDNYWLK